MRVVRLLPWASSAVLVIAVLVTWSRLPEPMVTGWHDDDPDSSLSRASFVVIWGGLWLLIWAATALGHWRYRRGRWRAFVRTRLIGLHLLGGFLFGLILSTIVASAGASSARATSQPRWSGPFMVTTGVVGWLLGWWYVRALDRRAGLRTPSGE